MCLSTHPCEQSLHHVYELGKEKNLKTGREGYEPRENSACLFLPTC